MFEVGRVCMKIAGRDSNKICVVVEVIDKNFVTVDGQTRRKKTNVRHLEPTTKLVEIKKGASHEEVKKALGSLNIEVQTKTAKKATEKPKAVTHAKKSKA